MSSRYLMFLFYMLTLIGGGIFTLFFQYKLKKFLIVTFRTVLYKMIGMKFFTAPIGFFGWVIGISINFTIFSSSWCCLSVFFLFIVELLSSLRLSGAYFMICTAIPSPPHALLFAIFHSVFFTSSLEIASINGVGSPTNLSISSVGLQDCFL